MSDNINATIKSKILIWHFLLVFIGAFSICASLYSLIIPIVFWMALGESAESDRIASLPLNMFMEEWAALILTILLCAIFTLINLKKLNFQRAKSYLLATVIISILYLFRTHIGDFLFEVSLVIVN